MRVPEDPKVNLGALDVVFQFYHEGSVGKTALKFRTLHQEGWHMMSNNDFVFGCALKNGLLDEI